MNGFVLLSTLLASAHSAVVAPFGYGPYSYAAPAVAGTPIAAAAPVAPIAAAPLPYNGAPITAPSSQFQAQDELGNINYGYSNVNSAKQEVGNAYGGVTGSYSYVDAYGIPQTVNYIADELGFRVQASNLPVAPVAPAVPALEAPVFTGVAPVQVEETPEVKAARAEHEAAIAEAKARSKRSLAITPAATAPLAYAAAAPVAAPLATPLAYNNLAYGYGLNYAAPLATTAYTAVAAPAAAYAAPVAAATYAAPAAAYAAPVAAAPVAATTYGAPAAVESTITRVKLNPGHAVAYRVD